MIQLLKEKPLNKITVKELCEIAQINRATFYKYFDNPYDLLNKMEQELLDNLEAKIHETHSDGFRDIFHMVLNDICENRDYYTILFSANGDERFRERLYSIAYGNNIRTIKKLFPDITKTEQEWLYYFIAEGCNGILHNWFNNGMQEPAEEVGKFAENMVLSINVLLPKHLDSSRKK